MNESKLIDHTLLKAVATKDDIINLCKEAVSNNFASVCVNPCWVRLAYQELKGTSVEVCTVIGFPLGASTTKVKVYETKQAILDGADEIDMVINVGAAKAGDFEYIYNEIKAVKDIAGEHHVVKVIIETCYLTDEEKVKACLAAKRAKADFVKTSTGFGTGGATFEDVALMKKTVGDLGVKASGGVKTREDFLKYVSLGATRIGTSNGTKLIGGVNDDSDSTY